MNDTGRPVPVQELPENQAPEVAYMLIEATGEKVPLAIEKGSVVDDEVPVESKKKRGRPRKEVGTVVTPEDVEAAELPRETGDYFPSLADLDELNESE